MDEWCGRGVQLQRATAITPTTTVHYHLQSDSATPDASHCWTDSAYMPINRYAGCNMQHATYSWACTGYIVVR